MMSRRTRRIAARTWLWVALLGTPGWAEAQDIFDRASPSQAAEQAQDTAAGVEPVPVPVPEIPLRARDAVARLRAAETQLSIDPDLSLIEDQLPEELESIARAHERRGRIVLENLSVRELWVLTSIWESHEARLAGWVETFEDELRELQEVDSDARRILDTWRLTRANLAREEGAAEQLAEEVERVLEAGRALQRIVDQRLDYLLGVKSQLDDGLAGVRRVLEELDHARASVRGRALTETAPPIWDVRSIRETSASQTAARVWAEDGEAMTEFVRDNAARIALHFFLFLVFVATSVRLRARIDVSAEPDDESLRGAADTLRRPISAALLVALILANALYPRAPLVFWQGLALAAVLPVYRLLPRSRNRVIARSMRALLALFAAVSLGELLIPPSLEYRFFTLAVAVLLTGTTGWLLRDADREEMRATGWGRLFWYALHAVFGMGLAATVANVLGWSMLAEILVTGVLYSTYFGLVTVIGYRVVAGVVRLLPRTRFGRASYLMRDYGERVTSRTISVLRALAFVTWVWLSLEAFEILGLLRSWFEGMFTESFSVGAFTFSLDRLAAFVLVILTAIYASRLIAFVLDVEVLPRLRLKRGAANAISTAVQWTILGMGLLTAASALGLEASQLAIVFGALSVGIGFGLQNIVSNFVSGLILIFEQPVKVGDKVEITSLSLIGEVRRIGVRASVVRTFDGAEVIVPNGHLISSEVVNWTLSDQRRRVHVEVGVAYGTDPHRVIEILARTAREHREVLSYPEPTVVFLGFGDSALNFRLLFWTATFDDFFRIRSELYVRTHDALASEGINIPFPQRDLHVRSMPGPEDRVSGPAPENADGPFDGS